ncbi:response regulator [uncultured Hoeflea sp.]|uniref:TackOD1 domain-containing metal-binding protein n=1 Tax=uncultured Hoeflea sp. TaxID=538666 RepID=UPI0030DB7213
MAPRILIVEDDPIVSAVLEQTLIADGYEVVIAGDGIEAVELTKNGSFDLALIDYNLPEIDGFASGRLIRSMSTRQVPTKLVAITGNTNALSERVGVDDVFDDMLPKPFLPGQLSVFVAKALRPAEDEERARSADAQWRLLGLPKRPKAICIPEASSPMTVLLASAFECVDRSDDFEAILLMDQAGTDAVVALRAMIDRAGQVPVINCTSGVSLAADASLAYGDTESWISVAETLKSYEARRETVNQSVVAGNPEMRLLASLYVSGTGIRPILDPDNSMFICFSGFRGHKAVTSEAGSLVAKGLLKRSFAERFHCCPGCASRRLNVREECPSCRSSNLTEAPIVHHFKCAYQGPESDFKEGTRLVCPKCSAHLRHYGGDYEKPGSVMSCGQCAEWTSEPAIGFLCVDCGLHTDGDAVATEDVHSYDLTEAAVAVLTSPAIAGELEANPEHVGLPRALKAELARLSEDMNVSVNSLAVIEIDYAGRDAVIRESGTGMFVKLRQLFVENLTNLLDEYGVVVQLTDLDYLVVDSGNSHSLSDFSRSLIDECRKTLGKDIIPQTRIMLGTTPRAIG